MADTDFRLAVLEAQWWRRSPDTVKPTFDFLSQFHHDSHAFWYERFVGKESFKEALVWLSSRGEVRYVYIAAHGQGDYLECPNGDHVSRADIKKCLVKALGASSLDGLYLGSCLFMSARNAQYLLSASSKMAWIAGYETSIDYIKSAALDLIFWHLMLRHGDLTQRARIAQVAAELRHTMGGLVDELGFSVYVRQQGTGELVDLMDRQAVV